MTFHFTIDNRPYQNFDIPWFIANPRSMILYDPRMGKTPTTIQVLAADERTKVVLIVCPKNAFNVWQDHIEGMWPQISRRSFQVRLVKGGKNPSKAKKERAEIWARERNAEVTFYIVTFASLERDWESIKYTFDTVIADEVHKRMRNRKNKTVGMIRSLTRPLWTHRVHFLSGTMAGKWGPADFWACFNILAPGRFTSYWNFVEQHIEVHDGLWGKEFIGILDVPRWHSVLDSMSRRRFRHVDAPDIPPVQRSPRRYRLTPRQRTVYDQLVSEDVAWTGAELVIAQNSLEKAMRLRQLLACPAVLDPELGVGGAMETLIEELTDEELEGEDRHVVIFSQFAKALPFFKAALNQAGLNDVYVLQGGMEPEDLRANIAAFRRTKGIILCSTQFAEAFSLEPATSCYSIGYSWDPNENKQAEERLLPQKGVNPINSYYFVAQDTYDEDVAYTVHQKNKYASVTSGSAKVFHEKPAQETHPDA